MPEIPIKDLPPKTLEELFRLEQRMSVFKWLIGTVGLTLITSIASWYFQNREVRLAEVQSAHEQRMQELSFEQQYLEEFVEYALEEDLASRIRFAHYFKSVSTNADLSEKWAAYHQELVASQDKRADQIGGAEALVGRQITRIFIGAEAHASMAGFHAYHVGLIGWADIGFHYYIDLDGSVKLARPIGRTPAFVLSHNKNAVAIGVACAGWTKLGDDAPEGRVCPPDIMQRDALLELTSKLLEDHSLTPDVIGKRGDYRPVPDLLEASVTELQEALRGARPRRL